MVTMSTLNSPYCQSKVFSLACEEEAGGQGGDQEYQVLLAYNDLILVEDPLPPCQCKRYAIIDVGKRLEEKQLCGLVTRVSCAVLINRNTFSGTELSTRAMRGATARLDGQPGEAKSTECQEVIQTLRVHRSIG